jgi:cation:H+ antiporter
LNFTAWPLWAILALFGVSAAVIAVVGVRIARVADRLADVTGWGEAIFGAVLLGGATSLPGIVTSVTTAWQGHPELSVSNAIGGIAAQTAFLALADMSYRHANLEHAAASIENLVQGALLVTLLALPLAAMGGPEFAIGGIHPASLLILAGYIFGLRLTSQARATPLWYPRKTRETRLDEPHHAVQQADQSAMIKLWAEFALLALLIATAGYLVAQTGILIAARTGLSETVVGGLFTALATSLPELVTAIAAVKQGALTLAVGDIIGGNSFDVLFLAFADVSYREGSIYHAITHRQLFIIAMTQVMTGILLLGLLRREKSGFANIGFESVLVLACYLSAVGVLFVS